MELTGVTSQSIFDDNAADIKLSWVAGLEGADRAFDVEFDRACWRLTHERAP